MEISQLRKKEEEGGEDLEERAKQWRGGWQEWRLILWATPFRDLEAMVSINMERYMNIKVIFAFCEI